MSPTPETREHNDADNALPIEELVDGISLRMAYDHFWAFRRMIHVGDASPFYWNWFTQDVANHLELFYRDMMMGKRPKLAIFTPPQHSKSTTARDFIKWFNSKHPLKKTIFGSYSDELSRATSREIQRWFDHPLYPRIFPNTLTRQGTLACNDSIIEFAEMTEQGRPSRENGYFMTSTVGGQINGFGLDLGVIDDPVKGRQEASSKCQWRL
jgi:hypothetical protein